MLHKPQTLSLFFFILLLLSPLEIVFAHGDLYYDLNPDKYFTKPFILSSATGTVTLLFEPQNDHLASFDFWFDNAGDSGTATFRLKNSHGTLLTSKTATIPHINPILGGSRIHIDMGSQVSVSNTEVYSVELSTEMPELRIYYVNRVEIVGYQTQIVSPYLIGVNKINGTETVFTFKFGLYEVSDDAPPVVYATSTDNISTTKTKIYWRANEPIDYKIELGTQSSGVISFSSNYNGSFTSCGEGEELCAMTLDVNPGTEYFFNLMVKDSWNNVGSYSGAFTSKFGPVISPSPTPSQGSGDGSIPGNFSGPSGPTQTSGNNTNSSTNPPNSISVSWPKTEESPYEYYEVVIKGKQTKQSYKKMITGEKNETVFVDLPKDTYTVSVYSVAENNEKQLVQEEVTTTSPGNGNARFYFILIGSTILVMIVIAIVYNKYKDYI